jgi:CRISPR-associated protein Csd1
MILQALMGYAEREALGDSDFEKVPVRWLIQVKAPGELAGEPIPLVEDPSAKRPVPKRLWRPFSSQNEISRGGRSYFLCDTLQRCLLYEPVDKSADQHAYFKALLAEAAAACPGEASALNAVTAVLGDSAAMQALRLTLAAAHAKPSDNATFAVGGRTLMESPEIKNFWRGRRARDAAPAGDWRICLATGHLAEALDTHEKIKLPGAGSFGANLISFDKPSFCSYGLAKAQNAALSAPAELKIRSALQVLVDKSRAQQLVFGDTTFLHWSRQAMEEDPVNLLSTAEPEAVARLLRSAREGLLATTVDAGAYYACALSGNGARVVVRDWIESTVSEVAARLARWFGGLGIVEPDGSRIRREFSIYQLLRALANEKLDKPLQALPHGAAEDLLRAALTGSPIPRSILAAALRREAVDRCQGGEKPGQTKPFLVARFALLKLCLTRLPGKENSTVPEQLPSSSADSAYLCGQLFAVLGRLQLLALGRVGAGIAERTYGGVSTRPASTLGPIFGKVPAYIKRANDRFPGAGTNKQKEIEALCQRLQSGGGLPQTLGLEEQARFALAYYCQLADYRARREEEEAAKKAAESDEETA